MSISSQIMEYLMAMPKDQLRTQDSQSIGKAVGTSADRASKLLYSLERTGRISLIRSGRSITGVDEVIRPTGKPGVRVNRPAGSTDKRTTAPSGPRVVRTPMLDKYDHAKHRAEELSSVSDEYFEVTFHENPIAEEALRLREALARLEEQYRELSTQYKMTLYEYEGVKDRLRNKHTESVVKAQQEAYVEAN